MVPLKSWISVEKYHLQVVEHESPVKRGCVQVELHTFSGAHHQFTGERVTKYMNAYRKIEIQLS